MADLLNNPRIVSGRLTGPLSDVAQDFGLLPAGHLDGNRYIPRYVAQVYLQRHDVITDADADAAAEEALRHAVATNGAGALGICVFGRPALGKTRLAWEAMQGVLPAATFVKWPHEAARSFDCTPQPGERVVLWLDDLHEYAHPCEAHVVNALPRRFVPGSLIIVATCRDGADERRARALLGSLVERLIPIRPADITEEEGASLADALEQAGARVTRGEFDRTPGSLLLGLGATRDDLYWRLSDDARRILWTLKLLRSAGIHNYAAERIRAVAVALFGLSEGETAWRTAATQLVNADLVRLGPPDAAGLRALEPVCALCVDEAIPDYPPPGSTITDDWTLLRDELARLGDADGLLNLGSAFTDLPDDSNILPGGDLRYARENAVAGYRSALALYPPLSEDWAVAQNNLAAALSSLAPLADPSERSTLLSQAVAAYWASLTVYNPATSPAEWAVAQNNLAVTLYEQAEASIGGERYELLTQAVAAYRSALTIYTREAAPLAYATAQSNLGISLRTQAELAETFQPGFGPPGAQLLAEAVAAFRFALAVFTPDDTPDDWAGTQNDLAVTLRKQAELAGAGGGAGQERLLAEAVAACRAALTVFTPRRAPLEWAAAEHNLGLAVSDQAALAQGFERERLLSDAIAAYRAVLTVYNRDQHPSDWAATQHNLAVALDDLADLADGPKQMWLLAEAVSAFRSALAVYTREEQPGDWAATQNNLANALDDLAALAQGSERLRLMTEAVSAYQLAQSVNSREAAPAQWAATQHNLAVLHLHRALTLAESGGGATVCAELTTAWQCAEDARAFFDGANPAFAQEAAELRWEIEDAMGQFGCPPATRAPRAAGGGSWPTTGPRF